MIRFPFILPCVCDISRLPAAMFSHNKKEEEETSKWESIVYVFLEFFGCPGKCLVETAIQKFTRQWKENDAISTVFIIFSYKKWITNGFASTEPAVCVPTYPCNNSC